MARFLRTTRIVQTNNFMWRGFLHYGFVSEVVSTVVAGFKTLLGVGQA